jgi:hypothetical protein
LNLLKIGAGVSSRITGAQRGALVYKKENPPTLRYYEALRAKDPGELGRGATFIVEFPTTSG